MPNYKESKIYAIKSTQAGKYFVGATTKRLCQRMAQHRQNYSKYLEKQADYESSFEILQYSDAQIQLLEAFECNSKDELNSKLQTYLESYKDKACNKPKEKKKREKKVIVRRKKTKPETEQKEVVETKTEPKPEQKEVVVETKPEEPKQVFTTRLEALRANKK